MPLTQTAKVHDVNAFYRLRAWLRRFQGPGTAGRAIDREAWSQSSPPCSIHSDCILVFQLRDEQAQLLLPILDPLIDRVVQLVSVDRRQVNVRRVVKPLHEGLVKILP